MTVSYDYTGKVAFVTGAGAGIGRSTALAFAAAGAAVSVVDRSEENARATASEIGANGGKAVAIRCDVGQEADVAAAVARTVETLGRLDFAFNNAGVEQPVTEAADISIDEWNRVINVNLTGVFLCMKNQISVMLRQGGGAIVNASSGAGVKGFAGQAAYSASKFGVVGLSKAAALDYAKSNVRVNVVAPGIVETPMMNRFSGGADEGRKKVIAQEPIGRMGRPEEIAGTVLWLCSDLAGFTVGATVVVDGGQTA